MRENNQPSVMLIEEMPSRTMAFLDTIKNQPISIEIVPELKDAVRQIREKNPDVITFDLSSRFAEKKAICEALLTIPRNESKLIFIVPTEFPELIFVPQHRLAGYITKPFYVGDVLGKLHSALYDKYVKQLAT